MSRPTIHSVINYIINFIYLDLVYTILNINDRLTGQVACISEY